MANDTYSVDGLANGPATITVTDDGSGSDWLVIDGIYATPTEIRLSWTVDGNGNATSASGLYFDVNGGHRLIVNGQIENVRGSNGADVITGNQLGNILYGDSAATGSGGTDSIYGGLGNDSIYGGAAVDTLDGGDGSDIIHGDGGADSIYGNAGIDTIFGGGGADSMSGGADVGDTLSYAKAATTGVEVDITFGVTTTGVGGEAAGDRIFGFTDVIGSAFDDWIEDTVKNAVAFNGNTSEFNGGAGNDRLYLGGGNDTGLGGSGDDRLKGESGNDILKGGDGGDQHFGGAGNDTMLGGAGNDFYEVDSTADKVFETTSTSSTVDAGGRETVNSSVSINLNAYAGIRFVEDLVLTGAGNTSGTGNGLANQMVGNVGSNTLNGGTGLDTLGGGAGKDSFVFNTALSASNVDRITDYVVADDTIRLDDAIFAGLALGALSATEFRAHASGQAGDASDRILYETDTGKLFFDADGTGAAARVQVALLTANLAMTSADFIVF